MYDTILFDFDGTLADSSSCSVIATQQAFVAHGLAAPEAAAITDCMGIPIEVSFRQMGAEAFSEAQFTQLLTTFRELYRDHAATHITAFNGVAEMLGNLKAAQKKVAVITSKKTAVAESNIEKLGLKSMIDIIIGSDLVKQYKPHPEGIYIALQQLFTDGPYSRHAIMVGDAVTDIEMGKNAGVHTCAVTWGAHSEARLRASEPDAIAHDVATLSQLLLA